MYNTLGVTHLDTFHQLFKNGPALDFGEALLFLDIGDELTPVGILHDEKQFVADDNPLV
jgi:hypothetical protein